MKHSWILFLLLTWSPMVLANETSNIDLSTGDLTLAVPVMKVPGRGGLDFDVTLNYSAGITLNQEASWVGLGWSLTPGAITRSVVGIPDDYNGSAFCQYKFPNQSSFWESLVGEFLAPQAKNAAVSAASKAVSGAIPGGWLLSLGYTAYSLARSVDKNGLAPTLIGIGQGLIPGSSSFSAGMRIGFMALSTQSGSAPANCSIGGGNATRQGFLHNPTYGEEYDVNGDPLADGGRPDIWSISGIPGGGRLVIANRNNLGRIAGMADAKFFLQNTPDPQAVDIEFYRAGNQIDYFVVRFPNGTRFIYGDSSSTWNHPSRDWVSDQQSITRLVSDPTGVFFKSQLNSAYRTAWKLTAILSHDYVDGNSDVNPLNSTASNKGNWMAFEYTTAAERVNSADWQSFTGNNSATNYAVYQRASQDLNETISGGERSDNYLLRISSPTHRADFITSTRLDSRSPDNGGELAMSNPGIYPQKLDRIELYSTTTSGGLVETVRLNKDSNGSELSTATQYALAVGAPGNTQGLGKYTLTQIQRIGYSGTMLPPVKFEYGYGQPAFNPAWQPYTYDAWGLYFANGNNDRNHNAATCNDNSNCTKPYFDEPGTGTAAAWSLTKVSWPTGSTSAWTYAIDDWLVGPYDLVAPREGCAFASGAKCTNWYAADPVVFNNYGGGLRVETARECDGLGNCLERSFDYTRSASVYLASSSPTVATISSGEVSVVPAQVQFYQNNPRDNRRGGHRGSIQVLGDVRYSRIVETLSEMAGTTVSPRGSIEHKFLTINSTGPETGFSIDEPLFDGIAPGFKEDNPYLECWQNFSGTPAWHGVPEACMGVTDLNWKRNAEYETTVYDAAGTALESTHRSFIPTEHFRWHFGDWELAPGANMGFGFSSGWLKPTQVTVTKGSTTLTTEYSFDGIYSQLSKTIESDGSMSRVTERTYTSPRGELYETWVNDGTSTAQNRYKKIVYEALTDGRTYPKREEDLDGNWKSQVTAWDSYGNPTNEEIANGLGDPVDVVKTYPVSYNRALLERVTKTLPSGSSRYTQYTYDSRTHRVTDVRNENGTTTSTDYDDLGRPTSLTDAAGIVTTLTHDPALDLNSSLARDCADATRLNRITSTVTVGGLTRTEVKSTDGFGRTVRVKRSGSDGTESWQDTVFVGGEVKNYEPSDTCGTTNVNYSLQTFESSPLSRPTRLYPYGSSTTVYSETTYAGNRKDVRDFRGHYTAAIYDGFGNEVESRGTEALSLPPRYTFQTQRAFDYLGNLVSETLMDTSGASVHTGDKVTRFAYDANGRRIGAEYPDADYPASDSGACTASSSANCDVQWRYDSLDRVIASSTAEQRVRGLEICYYYDSLNREVLRQTQNAGSCGTDAAPTAWSGDEHTKTWVKTVYDSYPTGWCSNAFPCSVPTGGLSNPIGLVTFRENPWEKEFFLYDAAGRVAKRGIYVKQGSSGPWAGGYVVEYFYNEAGELKRKKVHTPGTGYPTVSDTQYAIDGVSRVTSVQHNGSSLISNVEHETDGRVSSFERSNGIRTTYGYDDYHRLETENLERISDSAKLFERHYTYDENGNLSYVRNGSTASDPLVGSYTYDRQNQILTAEQSQTLGYFAGSIFKKEWGYDAAGNRVLQKSWWKEKSSDPWGSYVLQDYSVRAGSNRLDLVSATTSGKRLFYDADGNVLSRCSGSTCHSSNQYFYEYDSAGRVIRHHLGTYTGELNYFGSGEKRVFNERGGRKTLYIWDGDEVVYEEELNSSWYGRCGDANGDVLITISDAVYLIQYIFGGGPRPVTAASGPCAGDSDGNGLITISDAVYNITYIFGGGPATAFIPQQEQRIYVSAFGKKQYVHSVVNPTSTPIVSGKFYQTDLVGSTSYVMDASGTAVARYEYDPFGLVVGQSTLKEEQRTFHGRESEGHGDSTVLYFGARFYDPSLGRFIQRDTKDDELAYSYVENNPLTVTDPDGHAPLASLFSVLKDLRGVKTEGSTTGATLGKGFGLGKALDWGDPDAPDPVPLKFGEIAPWKLTALSTFRIFQRADEYSLGSRLGNGGLGLRVGVSRLDLWSGVSASGLGVRVGLNSERYAGFLQQGVVGLAKTGYRSVRNLVFGKPKPKIAIQQAVAGAPALRKPFEPPRFSAFVQADVNPNWVLNIRSPTPDVYVHAGVSYRF